MDSNTSSWTIRISSWTVEASRMCLVITNRVSSASSDSSSSATSNVRHNWPNHVGELVSSHTTVSRNRHHLSREYLKDRFGSRNISLITSRLASVGGGMHGYIVIDSGLIGDVVPKYWPDSIRLPYSLLNSSDKLSVKRLSLFGLSTAFSSDIFEYSRILLIPQESILGSRTVGYGYFCKSVFRIHLQLWPTAIRCTFRFLARG